MYIQVPSEIGLDGLVKDVDDIGAAHGNVVFEAVLADILHQLLQVVDLRDSDMGSSVEMRKKVKGPSETFA